jgi:hypothetical protein
VAPRESCLGAARTPYRGWFEQRGARVDFVLSHRGVQRRRQIPWLRRRRGPLAALEARGRLATFSVMLRALIAEHRLRWLLDDPPELSQPKGAPPVEEQIERERAEPRGTWRRQGLFATTLDALTRAPRQGPAQRRATEVQKRKRLGPLGRVSSGTESRARPGDGDVVALAAPAPATSPGAASHCTVATVGSGDACPSYDGGGGGGGSGGAIWLRATFVNITGIVSATGGAGGTATVVGPTCGLGGTGGKGSDGRVRVDAVTVKGSINPAAFAGTLFPGNTV